MSQTAPVRRGFKIAQTEHSRATAPEAWNRCTSDPTTFLMPPQRETKSCQTKKADVLAAVAASRPCAGRHQPPGPSPTLLVCLGPTTMQETKAVTDRTLITRLPRSMCLHTKTLVHAARAWRLGALHCLHHRSPQKTRAQVQESGCPVEPSEGQRWRGREPGIHAL